MTRQRTMLKPICLAVAILAFCLSGCSDADSGDSRISDWRPEVSGRAGKQSGDMAYAIVKVAKANIPAVVHIEVTEHRKVRKPLRENPSLRQFFGLPENGEPDRLERTVKGIGSGVLVDKTGYILTANHVVEDASKITVSLSDGRECPGEVTGTDPKSDLAVLKISRDEPFPYVRFADSDKVEVGQWVVAIGQPEGLDQSVTQGIISAKHRTGITSPTSQEDYLQTDAAINPGNSGGPLITLDGYVVGINSAILSESGGFMGIGFAIPSKIAIHVAKQLIARGEVVRGWLGLGVSDMDQETVRSLGMTEFKGALVTDVVEGGPADAAGIIAGDVILAYQGTSALDAGYLRNMEAETSPGTRAPLSIWRNDARKKISVTAGNLKDGQERMLSSAEKRLGIRVDPPSEAETDTLGIHRRKGIVVRGVNENSVAKGRIKPGDLILAINGRLMKDLAEFAVVVTSLPYNRPIPFVVRDTATERTGIFKVKVPHS